MPLILAGLALIAAFVYGVVKMYQKVAAAFGVVAGAAAVIALLAALTALGMMALRRYQAVHGKRIQRERILSLSGDWGSLRVDAERKNGVLEMDGQRIVMIFADIAQARAVRQESGWTVALTLDHHAQADWTIPVKDAGTARRWAKIFTLAAAQKL
ncbi:hypothetical protein [Cupriavidus sp. RAF12]|uniref:hypothetical protein n=1 Tax=Cupriavidus sp. RAF12 TaxID=3233050 RepID=UPI003F90ED10